VDVAEATVALLGKGALGLFHVTNAGCCSWHELAAAVFELSGVQANLTPITSKEWGAAAPRPGYSVLGHAAYEALGLPPLRPWHEALAAYLEERRQRAGM
jgi:dTDP-4-dehydrorhamnose reductase